MILSRKEFVFCFGTGRCGTKYLATLLARNLEDSVVYHERPVYGVHALDISHLQDFNSFGNTSHVQGFWAQKLGLCGNELIGSKDTYVETSHILFKGGLFENCLRMLPPDVSLRFITLERDRYKIARSLHMRGDMLNAGNMWLWYLAPTYKRNILDYDAYQRWGMDHHSEERPVNVHHMWRLWYIDECYARARYYERVAEYLREEEGRDVRVSRFDVEDLNETGGVEGLLGFLDAPPPDSGVVVPEPVNMSRGASFPFLESDESIYRSALDEIVVDFDGVADEWFKKSYDV